MLRLEAFILSSNLHLSLRPTFSLCNDFSSFSLRRRSEQKSLKRASLSLIFSMPLNLSSLAYFAANSLKDDLKWNIYIKFNYSCFSNKKNIQYICLQQTYKQFTFIMSDCSGLILFINLLVCDKLIKKFTVTRIQQSPTSDTPYLNFSIQSKCKPSHQTGSRCSPTLKSNHRKSYWVLTFRVIQHLQAMNGKNPSFL